MQLFANVNSVSSRPSEFKNSAVVDKLRNATTTLFTDIRQVLAVQL